MCGRNAFENLNSLNNACVVLLRGVVHELMVLLLGLLTSLMPSWNYNPEDAAAFAAGQAIAVREEREVQAQGQPQQRPAAPAANAEEAEAAAAAVF
jgi:hypothetical protein